MSLKETLPLSTALIMVSVRFVSYSSLNIFKYLRYLGSKTSFIDVMKASVRDSSDCFSHSGNNAKTCCFISSSLVENQKFILRTFFISYLIFIFLFDVSSNVPSTLAKRPLP